MHFLLTNIFKKRETYMYICKWCETKK